MVERTIATKQLKTKLFFANALADGGASLEDAVNKWLRSTRNIEVYDIVHKHRTTASGDEGMPYIGVVYRFGKTP